MSHVEMYIKPGCPYCTRASQLLQEKSVVVEIIDIAANPELRAVMMQRTGGRTVPQIIINDHAIGGCDDLYALDNAGKLDALLAKKKNEEK